MQHEALGGFSHQIVEPLHVLPGSQGDGHQGLSFAPREEGRTMSSREESDLRSDGPDLVETTLVGTLPIFQEVLPEYLFEKPLEHQPGVLTLDRVLFGEQLDGRLTMLLHLSAASELVANPHGLPNAGRRLLANHTFDLRIQNQFGHFPLGRLPMRV